jgi:hypothetical protein
MAIMGSNFGCGLFLGLALFVNESAGYHESPGRSVIFLKAFSHYCCVPAVEGPTRDASGTQE